MRRSVAVLLFALFVAAEPAMAIPAFARRYQVGCHFCHDIFPKLNVTGQRFRERGFRMEREDDFDASKWIRSVPVVVRGQGNRTLLEEGQDFNFGFLRGISAGNLGRRFSYWVDDGLLVSEKSSPSDERFTHTKPETAWVRFEVVSGGKLYARAGRIELDLPLTQIRTPHLFSYEIYGQNTGFETDDIGGFQEGIEIGGDLARDVRWSAAVVKGRNDPDAERFSDDVGKFDANLFLRTSKRVDRHRFGAFAYIGRNTLARSRTIVWDDGLLRLGADANVWLRRLNLYGVYLHGSNDNSVATPARPSGTRETLSFSGGFLQGDYHVRDSVALTLRLNLVSRPRGTSSAQKETVSGLFPGIQFWPFPHLKLSFEYGFLNRRRPGVGAIQVEGAI